jgi:hypothetical protein
METDEMGIKEKTIVFVCAAVLSASVVSGIALAIWPTETNCPVVSAPVTQTDKRMTNDEIIAEVHKCEAAGLRSTEYRSSNTAFGGTPSDRTVHIECGPKL